MRRIASLASLLLICGACTQSDAPTSRSSLTADDIQSGYAFLTAETQNLQDDDFANPGYLWVEQGEALFNESENGSPSCISCHQDGLRGTAARYPAYSAQAKALLNLESQINQCREQHQNLPALDYESNDLLALTAYIAIQSRGLPIAVELAEQTQDNFENGEDYFYTRRGQFNFSCHQCHDLNWGKKLRGDTISQGHGNGFPAYRLEWQSLGSLHRRFNDCDLGVRAEPLPLGDQTYIDLEYYLAVRASGLDVETPAVRR